MRQNRFECEFQESLRRYEDSHTNFWYTRLYDTRTFRHISEKMYAIRQPGDYAAMYKGKTWFFELKSTKNPTSYYLAYLQPHQLESLLRIWDTGNLSYIILNDRSRRCMYKAYAIKPYTMLHMINQATVEGRKSIKWGRVKENSIVLPRVCGGLWDLNDLFAD